MTQERNDLFKGYLEEVQAYIPIIHQRIEQLCIQPDHAESFSELYRLVHIIKGASSMLGVHGLSRIAGYMESMLDEIQEGHLSLSERALEAMQATAHLFEQYCQGLEQGTPLDDAALFAQTQNYFSHMEQSTTENNIFTGLDALIETDEILSAALSPSDAEPSLIEEFRAEAEQHSEILEQALDKLFSAAPQPTLIDQSVAQYLNTIRRSVHTLKGASAVVGLPDISAYAHLIEDFLDWLCESATMLTPQQIQQLSASLDALAALIFEPEQFDEQAAEEAIQQLHCFIQDENSTPEQLAASPSQTPKDQQCHPSPSTASATRSPSTSLFSDDELLVLREGFQEEAEEHLQLLHQSLETITQDVDASTEITPGLREEIRTIRRCVHTIKGASAVIGLQDVASYAHTVEDFLDWLFEGALIIDPAIVNTLAEAIDALAMLVESPETVTPEKHDRIQRHLDHLINHTEQKTTPPPVVEIAPVEAPQHTQSELPADQFPPPAETPALHPDKPMAAPAESTKTIRINQGQLDTLINLTNELLVGVSGFDRDMDQFHNALHELDLTTKRLKDIALELETKFEVKALDRLSERFSHLNETFNRLNTRQSFAEFDALELDRYTQLNLIIRSLNESTIDVSAIHSNLDGIFSNITGDINRQHRTIRELQVHMMRARMSPMASLSSRLNRTVRDVASRLGKSVRLVLEGERVELDRTVWEKLADPLMHLIRNAVHHGIELPDVRVAQNKPATAIIRLTAGREGNHIVLRFSDDGQGLDFEAIKAKARQFGLGEQVNTMDQRQLIDLIFYPGFSTKTISEISGRGVGMDVVRESVKELQGSISTETIQGQGTTFILRIPLTLGIVRALLVLVGDTAYGIPLNDVRDIQRLDTNDITPQRDRCTIQGKTTPFYSLPALLGFEEDNTFSASPLVLTIHSEGRTIALSIPQVTGQKEIVVKGLGSHLKAVPGISGAAVMGDGSIVPVIDVPDLIQSTENTAVAASTFLQRQTVAQRTKTILIVDDSISIRRVMSRLVTANGWIPVEAKDGQDALTQLEQLEHRPDCILLDIEMPNMNGFEFLSKLSNIPYGKTTPVIMLTSRTSNKHREKAFQLGAKAFLNKPCKDEEFVETVTRLTESAALDVVAS
jgi:chemosensory pili system protein ChpA (sensor histidine kinase/response regulator)